jgi:hypothetical protein
MSKLRLNSGVSYVRIPSLVVDRFEVRSMPLNDLFCPVRDVPVFAEELAHSISDSGLANPVIVVRGPYEDLYRELRGTSERDKQLQLPDKPVVNCVYGGTNRISAARSLGYTHIDCVLVPTFALGFRLQELQRNAYTNGSSAQIGQQAGV